MRFRPKFDVPFLCVEAILIGGHYAFPVLPHAVGLALFYCGIVVLIVWVLVRLGFLDNVQFLQHWFGSPVRDLSVGDAIAYVCYRDWGHCFGITRVIGGEPCGRTGLLTPPASG